MSNCHCHQPVSHCTCNSHNSHMQIEHNYHGRPVYHSHPHCGGYHVNHAVHHHQCGCAPQSVCSCGSGVSYAHQHHDDCGCGAVHSAADSCPRYRGCVGANTAIGTYPLLMQLPAGRYLVTGAENVQDGEILIGTTQIAKTIGTEFMQTAAFDVSFRVDAPLNAISCIELTKIG